MVGVKGEQFYSLAATPRAETWKEVVSLISKHAEYFNYTTGATPGLN